MFSRNIHILTALIFSDSQLIISTPDKDHARGVIYPIWPGNIMQPLVSWKM